MGASNAKTVYALFFSVCVHCSLSKAFLFVPKPVERYRLSQDQIKRVLWGIAGGADGGAEGRYSFVEGSEFHDEREEIEAMGGDPFFFDRVEGEDEAPGSPVGNGDGNEGRYSYVEGSAFDETRAEIEAMGGDPFFLDSSKDTEEEAEAGASLPDVTLLSDFASVGGVLDDIEDVETAEIQDLGGDPAFLDEPDEREAGGEDEEGDVAAGSPVGSGDGDEGRYSYVEGSSFDDTWAEIEAMGGDPFFFDSSEDTEEEAEAGASLPDQTPSSLLSDFASVGGVLDVIGDVKTAEIEDLGGDPAFHDEREAGGEAASVPEEPPSPSFSSDSFPSSTVDDVIGDSRMAEIEALGGDPFFLDEDDDIDEPASDVGSPSDVKTSSFLSEIASFGGGVMDVIGSGAAEERYVTDGRGPTPKCINDFDIPVEEWDGTVDEDAHLDFD